MRIIICFLCLSVFLCGCQSEHKYPLDVLVAIEKKEETNKLLPSGKIVDVYAIKIALINKSDSMIDFCTMSCNWPITIILNNDKIGIAHPECDSNYPEVKHLSINDTINYVGQLYVLSSAEISDSINIGFCLVRPDDIISNDSREITLMDFQKVLKEKTENNEDLIWSNPFRIKE